MSKYTCAACGQTTGINATVLMSNIILAERRYCSTQCLVNDWEAFADNAKKGAQCAAESLGKHAAGDCQCGIIGS
jgi:hypothetical protein